MKDRNYIAKDITAQPLTIRSGLLGRMEADCEYYLGYGFRNEKKLWGQNVADHIFYMKALWNSFSPEEKPEWLSMEKIEAYEREMSKNPEKALQIYREGVNDSTKNSAPYSFCCLKQAFGADSFTDDFMADGREKETPTEREKL